jgi:hypothetical protein
MGVYLSRKYHYLLRTEKAMTLSTAERLAAAHAITQMENTLETDLPEWVQKLITDTLRDPEALQSKYKYMGSQH